MQSIYFVADVFKIVQIRQRTKPSAKPFETGKELAASFP